MKFPVKSLLVALCLAGSTATYAQIATSQDKAFVAKVSQGGMYEVAAGKLAMNKATTQDVRDLATAEVHDHILVGGKLKSVSAEAGITFSSEANAEFSAKLKHLATLQGTKFDAEYLAEMGAIHDADGAAFEKESKDGGTADFRAFGSETHKIVLRHIGAIKAVPAN